MKSVPFGGRIVVALAVAFSPAALLADLVKLKNGGEVRGRIDRGTPKDRPYLKIRTLSGVLITIERKQTQFVTHRPLIIEEYETRAKDLPRTVPAQWGMAEWCRTNGLTKQRKVHLLIVVEIEPDHKASRIALGHRFRGGKWVSKEQEMKALGYVFYKGKWITPQERDILEKSHADLAKEKDWHKKIRMWKAWLKYPRRQREGIAAISGINDPYAVTALARNFRDENSKEMRLLYVRILGKIEGDKPVVPLVTQALHDVDYEVRWAALVAIRKDQYSNAIPHFLKALKSDLNAIVQRAGIGLQQVGDDSAIPALIDALVTVHRYRVKVLDPTSPLSFNANGSGFAQNNPNLPPEIISAMQNGTLKHGAIIAQPAPKARKKTIVVQHTHLNEPVLAALRKLTSQNFGYDERTWKLWFSAKKKGAN